MNDLRTAAQQALEALKMMRDRYEEYACPACDHADAAIYALRAALVEDAMQKFTDVNQELQAALGCDHCNSPLYAAVKCRVCGRETDWISYDKTTDVLNIHGKKYAAAIFGEEGFLSPTGTVLRVEQSQPETVTLTVVPQRKPLTEEEALDIARTFGAQPWPPGSCVAFARAIERAHGITS